MDFSLPKIYPITDTPLSGLSHSEQVRRMCDGSATFIQLREKTAPPGAFCDDAEKAIEIARSLGKRIVINDRVDIALALNADGVHLGQDDLPPEKAREILGGKAVIGFSTHSLKQAIDALNLPVDYIAVGPVFSTSSKAGSDPAIGLETLRAVRTAIGSFPLVAIGGINVGNLEDVLKSGADSAAIITDILSDTAQIEAKTRLLFELAERRKR
ncbi:MAG: thiamine phosphate synthase [Blastocatellia bacterium]